jgi:hypothetical protein
MVILTYSMLLGQFTISTSSNGLDGSLVRWWPNGCSNLIKALDRLASKRARHEPSLLGGFHRMSNKF